MRHPLKPAVLGLLTALAWSACSLAAPEPVVRIEPGRPFSLKPGAWAQSADGALRVGFEGVASDSRCPKGVQCMWAGDAVVRVWLQQGSGARQPRELHTAPGPGQATGVPGAEVVLVGLAPYPVAGRSVVASTYVATLTLGAGSAAPVR
jgi:hypothetical protein